MTIKTTCLALLVLAACGGEEARPPASLQDVLDACDDWSFVVLGGDQGILDDRIAAGKQDCYDQLTPEAASCWDNLRESFERCMEREMDQTCEERCGADLSFCFTICAYSCP